LKDIAKVFLMNAMRIVAYPALLAAVLNLLVPAVGVAAPCTPGVDCYCDKVRGGSLDDPQLLFCEDFEAPTLYQNTGVGNGAPYYGPWYDATGMMGNRGNNSYWNKKYGNGVNSFLFRSGEPASPTLGSPCTFSLCTGAKVWERSDLWSANAYGPQLAIFTQSSDFSFELSSLAAPSNKAGGGSGVFDGNANLAYRIAPGRTHGIAGEAQFASGTRNIGMTMAVAYPSNSLSSGIWGTSSIPGAWKHNEWGTVYNTSGGFDGLFIFYNQVGPRSGIPFAGFLGAFRDQGYTNCGSIVATVGNAQCIGSGLGIYWNSPANYSQPTDWPFGTWGCVRGYLENAGLANMRMRVWFQGPSMTSERLIIDFTANGTQLDNRNGYSNMKWNAYANTNQGGGYTPTTALTFRYEDNVHVRAGTPVSCAQIGFTGGGGGVLNPPSLRLAD
jgi:hypothetical protein